MNSFIQINGTTFPVEESQFIMYSIVPVQGLPNLHRVLLLHDLYITDTSLETLIYDLVKKGGNKVYFRISTTFL